MVTLATRSLFITGDAARGDKRGPMSPRGRPAVLPAPLGTAVPPSLGTQRHQSPPMGSPLRPTEPREGLEQRELHPQCGESRAGPWVGTALLPKPWMQFPHPTPEPAGAAPCLSFPSLGRARWLIQAGPARFQPGAGFLPAGKNPFP